jgi:outer membrane protein
MKRSSRFPVGVFLFLFSTLLARAQTFPTPDYFHRLVYAPASPAQLPAPKGLRDYVVEGKLRLSLADAIRLALRNNTEVRLNELQVEGTAFGVQRAYQPFDPMATSTFSTSRAKSATYTQLQGATTLSDLEQQAQFGYSQTFQTGTNYQVGFNAGKSSTNSVFYFFNPSISGNLNFSITQPLLRNRGFAVNRAPIVIARRNLQQSQAAFEGQVNDSVQQVVNQYWAVVQTRENLAVLRKSQELAEATYQQNKRALELGALPPLDIYRSEAEVATRRVAVIQAEYAVKQAEDQLRRLLGTDQDPYIRALDFELVEKADPPAELFTIDQAEALKRGLERRPELEALRQQLAASDTSIRVAHNHLLPDLSLTGLYSSNGLGGNQFDISGTPPVLIARGGLSDALGQLFRFSYPTYGFSVRLNLPIKNRAAAADLGNALVTKRRGLYLMRQLQENLTLEVSNAVHQLEQAKISMAATRVARDLAQKNLDAEERKFQLGAQTIFFVLEAQTQLAQAELSVAQAQVGYQLAVTAVNHAMGTLLDRHGIQIAEAIR